MICRTAAAALVALATAAPSLGCAIAPVLRTFVNDGAVQHANEHVAERQPGERVLCSIAAQPWEFTLGPDHVITDHGWLIPSDAVAAFGCPGAYARATGTSCGPEPQPCIVNDIWWGQIAGNPYQPMAAPVDPPGIRAAIAEDDPGWDCRLDGNERCGRNEP